MRRYLFAIALTVTPVACQQLAQAEPEAPVTASEYRACYEDEIAVWTGERHDGCVAVDEFDGETQARIGEIQAEIIGGRSQD